MHMTFSSDYPACNPEKRDSLEDFLPFSPNVKKKSPFHVIVNSARSSFWGVCQILI